MAVFIVAWGNAQEWVTKGTSLAEGHIHAGCAVEVNMAFGQKHALSSRSPGASPGYGDDGLRRNVETRNLQHCRTIAHGQLSVHSLSTALTIR